MGNDKFILDNFPAFNANILKLTDLLQKKTGDKFLIWVHAKWCGHCINMKDNWDTLAKMTARGFHVIQIEQTVYDHMYQHHNDHILIQIIGEKVRGYPHLVALKNGKKGKIIKYDGDRIPESFVKFMRSI